MLKFMLVSAVLFAEPTGLQIKTKIFNSFDKLEECEKNIPLVEDYTKQMFNLPENTSYKVYCLPVGMKPEGTPI